MNSSKMVVFVFALLLVFVGTGCLPQSVSDGERVVKIEKGQAVEVLSPGQSYTDFMSPRTSYETVDISRLCVASTESNPTIDRQNVTVPVNVCFTLTGEDGVLLDLMENNRQFLFDVDYRKGEVSKILSQVLKDVTASFTIGQLKGSEELTDTQLANIQRQYEFTVSDYLSAREIYRSILQSEAQILLNVYAITIEQFLVTDVTGSPEYEQLEAQRANENAQQELLREQQETQNQQAANDRQEVENQQAVLEAQAENQRIQLEAQRDQASIIATTEYLGNALYIENPELLQLEIVKLQSDALSQGNVIYLPVPENLYLGINGPAPSPTPFPTQP